jgi:DNA N-6-adenine-methyltransferase Dam
MGARGPAVTRTTTLNRALFSSASETWRTPAELYEALDREFRFTLDPCPARDPREAGMPLFGTDGLFISWRRERVYCNPPYGRGIGRWLEKAWEGDVCVFLLPSRTDTAWFHEYAPRAEVRFLRGRLHFNGAKTGAPFPSVLFVFRNVADDSFGGAK